MHNATRHSREQLFNIKEQLPKAEGSVTGDPDKHVPNCQRVIRKEKIEISNMLRGEYSATETNPVQK